MTGPALTPGEPIAVWFVDKRAEHRETERNRAVQCGGILRYFNQRIRSTKNFIQ